ncbi:type I restriction enzyme HsdR N-terminal domain-containing protein [Helicobacter sp. 13S00477-4]|uniref:type I restriction enzyme HsdR N-terminal domain-containing protein n=1 Tax=Helicobacter sp. 13S00477-4 TaxID=1905759 RepID=UPI002151B2D4|nr:type I restriction enzyme HsdR N-terminal domain-containing protein [Helicobacter sp. 13S00477-4]
MKAQLPEFQKDFYFLKNNLFTTYTLQVDFKNTYDFSLDLTEVFDKICSLYDKNRFAKLNEAQLEKDFISKVLEALGWHLLYQEIKIIQGKQEKPDYILFPTLEEKKKYETIPQEKRRFSNQSIAAISESKAYNIEIDNKKVQDNPHFQILHYLNNLKINFGFLTNAKFWRFYDNSKLSSNKIFYEIDLEAIIEKRDIEAFRYFYFIFNAKNFAMGGGA